MAYSCIPEGLHTGMVIKKPYNPRSTHNSEPWTVPADGVISDGTAMVLCICTQASQDSQEESLKSPTKCMVKGNTEGRKETATKVGTCQQKGHSTGKV